MTPDRTLDADAVEHLLRDHLGRRAGAAEPSLAPVAGITRQARRRERRQVLLAGAAVVAMVAGGAVVASPWLDGTSRSLPATSTDPGPDGRWTVHDIPTRGDLAGSAAWRSRVDEVTRKVVEDEGVSATVDNLLFAGHVQQGVLVLASLTDGRGDPGIPATVEPLVLAFWSPTGSRADLALLQLSQTQTGRIMASDGTPDDVVAVSVDAGGAGYLVTVPLVPARTVTVSTGPVVARDASVRRSWQQLPVQDGVAVATLDPSVVLRAPLVKVDGGRPWPARRGPANSRDEIAAFVGETAQAWGIGDVPDEAPVQTALQALLDAVPVERMTVEPVFHGREQPSTSDVVLARVRLDDGSVLQVGGLVFDDIAGTGRTQAVTTLVAGRPIAAAKATTTPFTWIDDTSYGDPDTMRARARLVLPGAVRVEVRDVGVRPCAGTRRLGSADVDGTGIGTVVIDVPVACAAPMAPGDDQQSYPDIVMIAYGQGGKELGRASIQPMSMYRLPDTQDFNQAIAP